MAQQFPEPAQLQITGLNTAGHPLLRPRGSSYQCDNFRVMPGGWLRLRGGRKLRVEKTTGKFIQLYPYQWPPELMLRSVVPESHWVQHRDNTTDVFWKSLALTTFALSSEWEIETAYDEGWALNNPVAAVTINHLTFFYNGMGIRDATSSRPPLMTYQHQQNAMRYVGLDAWCPTSGPTATIGTGSISCNGVRRLWVGLRNGWSTHYSNAIHVMTFGPTADPISITVSGLKTLKLPTPSPQDTPTNNFGYVFYLTVEDGQVPYMVMDPTFEFASPVVVDSVFDSYTLDFPTLTDIGGIYIDPTREMPTTNFPPRPMRSMCYVGGRVYGVLLPNAGHLDTDFPLAMPIQPEPTLGHRAIPFSYDTRTVPNQKQHRGVVWSHAAHDAYDHDFVGIPEESWPLDFFSFTPSGEEPLIIDDAKTRVLVICPSSCFLLEETADGIHEWTEISAIRGITNVKTLTKTSYGHVWLTQHNEIVLNPLNSASLIILSESYQSSIKGKPASAAYILDVKNQVDRYQVWMDNGTSICHDFKLQTAYTESPNIYDCAHTLTRTDGTRLYCVANQSLYTIEGQPENGNVLTMDEMPSAPNRYIEGHIERNWDDFGDPVVRKDFSWVDVITGHSDLVMHWSANFSQLPIPVPGEKTPQSPTDYLYRFKMKNPTAFWYQFTFWLIGTDSNLPEYYALPGDEGNLDADSARLRSLAVRSVGKPADGTPLNTVGPLYPAVVQAWLMNEGTGSAITESRSGLTGTLDLTYSRWVANGSPDGSGSAIEINGGYPFSTVPPTLVLTPASDSWQTPVPLPPANFIPIVTGPTAHVNPDVFSALIVFKINTATNFASHSQGLIYKADEDTLTGGFSIGFQQVPGAGPENYNSQRLYFLRYTATDWQEAVYYSLHLTDGAWHTLIITNNYLAGVDSPAAVHLYIDGVEASPSGYTGELVTSDSNDSIPMVLGSFPQHGGSKLPLYGLMDTVQFYNRVLTPAEVAILSADPYYIWGADPGPTPPAFGPNFYGSILRLLYQAGASTNRT